MDLQRENILSLRTMLDSKKISAVELTEYFLDKIEHQDNKIGSFITICREEAINQAKHAQQLIDQKSVREMTGIPIAVKDNICTKDIRTTCASRMLSDFTPPYNATVVGKLLGYGAVIVGKTNMDEFAMGSTTQNSYYKKTKNPYDLSRVPGGSSGGSAASVSAGFIPGALGSDTGGSIRQPASFCGVTGIKPTYGAVSRYGLIAFASSLDQIGPIAKSAEDCAILLNAITDYDPRDATCVQPNCFDYKEKIGASVKGLKIALPKEFFAQGISEEVKVSVLNAAKRFESIGAQILETSMPSLKYAIPAYYLISSAEASSNLARFDGVKYGYRTSTGGNYEDMLTKTRAEGFGSEVKRRILLGTYALSSGYYDAYYKKAVALREIIREDYNKIFQSSDAILTPTAPTTAFGMDDNQNDPVKMYLADICTVTVNIAGLPAISTTCGYDKKGLPIGMSLVGKAFDELTILQLADAFEREFERKDPVL